jgi:hypothetical protein
MRKTLAALLLVCLGILIPLAASPVRVCLLDGTITSAVFPAGSGDSCEDSECCPDCDRDADPEAPCCVDLDELPDSPVPHPPVELPPAVFAELPQHACPEAALAEPVRVVFTRSESIRGPDSPTAYRAVLGVWRL